MDFNSYIWKIKKENNISLKSPISDIEIPENLAQLKEALTKMHNLE